MHLIIVWTEFWCDGNKSLRDWIVCCLVGNIIVQTARVKSSTIVRKYLHPLHEEVLYGPQTSQFIESKGKIACKELIGKKSFVCLTRGQMSQMLLQSLTSMPEIFE